MSGCRSMGASPPRPSRSRPRPEQTPSWPDPPCSTRPFPTTRSSPCARWRRHTATSTSTVETVKTFDDLFAELSEKAQTRPEGSGTVRELDAGVHAIGKKIVEEAAESWMAAEHEGPARAAEEISQLLYHAQVLMLATVLDLDDVYSHL